MKFVCFSFLSPPATDAESSCTGRFLSALASRGHEVHLITLDYYADKMHLPDDVVDELLDRRIKVTRLPLKSYCLFRRLLTKIRYGLFGICTEYIEDAVRVVRKELKENPGSILITRCAWPASNLVGWYCRKDAKMWIPHFSDPYPSYKKMTLGQVWRYPFSYFWLIRCCRDSSFVSVTCKMALRYFNAITMNRFSEKFHVAYHIGYPRLREENISLPQMSGGKMVVHVGAVMNGRPVDWVARVCSKMAGIRFVQYGRVANIRIWPKEVEVRTINNHRMATSVMIASDAVLICDLDSGWGYSPYLASKFVYALFCGKPLICVSQPNSEMGHLATEINGVYFVRFGDERGLEMVMAKLKTGELESPSFDHLRRFTPDGVAQKYEERIHLILNETLK